MKRRRILMIVNRFYPQVGGAEINQFLQAKELARHFDVDVFVPKRDVAERDEVVDGVRIVRLWNSRAPLRGVTRYLGARTLCPSIAARIIAGRYDLVHVFPSVNANNQMALAAAHLRRIPVFLSVFDLVDYAETLRTKGVVPKRVDLLLSQRQRRALRQFASVFAIAEREVDVIRLYNANVHKARVPIDVSEYELSTDPSSFRRIHGVRDDELLILCVGRVSFVKGQDLLLRALPLLRSHIEKFKVLIVGRIDYEPLFYDELRRFVDAHALGPHVVFTGMLDRAALRDAYSACDIHVIPVRFMNAGAVVIETWAARKPVLQSDRVDPSYVREGENGFTYDAESAEDLASKLVRLARSSDLRAQMGIAGRALVEAEFQYPSLIAQYVAEYERVLGAL